MPMPIPIASQSAGALFVLSKFGAAINGPRAETKRLRTLIEAELANGNSVFLDFAGVEASHDTLDELLGELVAQEGPQVMQRLAFRGCSLGVKGLISFVVANRAKSGMSQPLPS